MKHYILIIFIALSSIAFAKSPEFVIKTPSGGWFQYSSSVSNQLLTATLTNKGNIWELHIIANDSIKTVLFPWESQRHPVDNDISDDIFYYPLMAGVTEKASNCNNDWHWQGGLIYPGLLFAPLVIVADADNGRIIAAVNYPPKKVTPYYAAERIYFTYENINLLPGDTITFSTLIDSVIANTTQGEKAWMLALDKYRNWLNSVIPTVSYPAKLQNANGWLNVDLMNQPAFNLKVINTLWTQWRTHLPWMQCWGQMSNYSGDPSLAVPPLQQGEQTGCCLLIQDMHLRYIPLLIQFIQDSVIALGYSGGYYSAPFYGDSSNPQKLLLDTDIGKTWLFNWIDKHQHQYNANAFYIDVLGRDYWGNPDTVRNLFDGVRIRPMTVIEGMVDIYPAAGLLSGSFVGMGGYNGRPGLIPENSVKTTFPNMQRYLLNDRAIFMGQSNGDHIFWGPTANYWLERQIFLLGAKFDAITPNDNYNPNNPNPAITLAISERNNVNWWQRKPAYFDTKGITNIPVGVDIRRFVDTAGCNLFAVDNWSQQTGQTFIFQGQPFNIPSKRLSIIVDCIHTDIHDNSIKKIWVHAYPNPITSFVTIQTNVNLKDAILTVYNLYGQDIKQIKNISGQTVVLSRDNLRSGLYFVRLTEDSKQIEAIKLIITD